MAAITPITPLNSIASAERITKLESIIREEPVQVNNANPTFADMLRGMVDTINQTDAETKTDAYNLAMGFVDLEDLHNIEINAIRADLALRTMTSVRNKVLEAYSEVMRITV